MKREKRKEKSEKRRRGDCFLCSMPDGQARLISIEDRTYSFALALIKAFRANPPRDQADRVMWHQLLKSGTSAGANSAESPGSQSKADWRTKRHIALKEMRESQFWLRLLRDANPGRATGLEQVLDESGQLVAILTTIVKNAKKKPAQPG